MTTSAQLLLALTVSMSLAAAAADGADSSSDGIDFGFKNLHLGMTQNDANALYHFVPGMTYDYDGCRFRLLPSFVQDKLISFDLLATGTGASESCAIKIETELNGRYGQSSHRLVGLPRKDGVHADWKKSGVDITYNSGGLKDRDSDGQPGFEGTVDVNYYSHSIVWGRVTGGAAARHP